MTFKQKWENYWYHYKFVTFAGIFVIFFLIIGISSFINKKTYDLQIVYYSNQYIGENTNSDFEKSLIDNNLIRDVDGDGEKNFYMDTVVRTFMGDEQLDVGTQQRIQAILMAGEHTLVLAHQYALEDHTPYFEDISHMVREGDKTFVNSNENFVSGISVEGNKYLEELGFNTEGLYVAMRRRTTKDIEKGAGDEYFEHGYEIMEYILEHN